MKTRTDFVSNSSSSSFIVSCDKEYSLDQFITDTVKNCIKHAESDYDEEWKDKLAKINTAILNYSLIANECLFLGRLMIDAEYEDSIWCPNIPTDCMWRFTKTHYYRQDDERFAKTDDYKETADSICEYANAQGSEHYYTHGFKDSRIFFISKTTIRNTRALIAEGKDLHLDKWMDLDAFDKMLADGHKLFGIHVNQGGDGQDFRTIYSLGGWSGQNVFGDIPYVEILAYELC